MFQLDIILYLLLAVYVFFHILPNDEIQLLDTHWIPLSS